MKRIGSLSGFVVLLAMVTALVAAVVGSAGGDDLPTGPELLLAHFEKELELAIDGGMADDDPAVVELTRRRDRLIEVVAEGPPDPPDPAVVDRLLAEGRSGPPEWDSGPIPCEGALGLPDFSENSTLRCVAVPQDDNSLIMAYLTPDGESWVMHKIADVGAVSDWVDTPVLNDFKSAEIDVEGETILIVGTDDTVTTLDTALWREMLRSAEE